VILAWQVNVEPESVAVEETADTGSTDYPALALILGLFIVAGLIFFIFLKKHVGKTSGKTGRFISSKYRPIRDMSEEQEQEHYMPVDPDLTAAAEAFRKERRLDEESREGRDEA
jgi:hypothetical protein